jgi:hypothetical protein
MDRGSPAPESGRGQARRSRANEAGDAITEGNYGPPEIYCSLARRALGSGGLTSRHQRPTRTNP